ncbi:MAG TPA: LPS export ABC transporter permease LptF [Steroidobacteraceae bacterium]
MGGIFFRYLLREVVAAFLGVTSVLLVILMTNQLAFVLARAAERQIPGSAVPELLWLAVQQNITILLPIGLVLAIVIALGRLYHESELAAAQACGIGPWALYAPVLLCTGILAGLAAWLSLSLAPAAAKRTFELRQEALRTAEFRQLASGQFRGLGAEAVLYFRSQDHDGTLRDVFFQRKVANVPAVQVVIAASARYALVPDGSLYTVTLYDGERYEGTPGQGQFRTIKFREQTIPIRIPDAGALPARTDTRTTAELIQSSSLKDKAELHWRLAAPVMVVLLGILGVPLAHLRPRAGRYSRVAYVVLLYFIYQNLLSAGQVWITHGVAPPWVGLWWVHALVLALGVAAVGLPGALARWRYRRHAPVLA